MSISMKSNKAQMYSEIERLRAGYDLVTQQLTAAREEIRALRSTRNAQRVEDYKQSNNPSLAQFCEAYCKLHGVRSVPGVVVNNWRRNNQKRRAFL